MREGKEAIGQKRAIVTESPRSYFAGKPKTKEEAFDGWHGSVMFEAGAPANLTVGQAQKILNMAFKYLYCCRDMCESRPGRFACRHMPLDGYTLAWYCREIEPGYGAELWSAIDDPAKYVNAAERPGYSGTMTASRIAPASVQMGFGIPVLDTEGRAITSEAKGEGRPVPRDWRYAPLMEYFAGLEARSVTLSFADIERMAGGPLPVKARKDSYWWNRYDPGGPTRPPRAWVDGGYRIAKLDIRRERVRFEREEEGSMLSIPPAFSGRVPDNLAFEFENFCQDLINRYGL